MEMEGTVLIRAPSETALDKGDESPGPQPCQLAGAVQASHFVPVLVALQTRTLLAMVLVGYDCLSNSSLSMQ